jgi:hypothetical protein
MLEAKHKMKLFYAVRPWEDEPDHAEWLNEVGYKCRIRRNEITGSLNGYVGIPRENKFWGVSYEESNVELSEIEADVHGGITYSAEGDDGWWYFGFDTSQAGDFAPRIVEHWIGQGRKDFAFWDCMNYKTWEFVEHEIHWLGKRLWQYNEYDKEERCKVKPTTYAEYRALDT